MTECYCVDNFEQHPALYNQRNTLRIRGKHNIVQYISIVLSILSYFIVNIKISELILISSLLMPHPSLPLLKYPFHSKQEISVLCMPMIDYIYYNLLISPTPGQMVWEAVGRQWYAGEVACKGFKVSTVRASLFSNITVVENKWSQARIFRIICLVHCIQSLCSCTPGRV